MRAAKVEKHSKNWTNLTIFAELIGTKRVQKYRLPYMEVGKITAILGGFLL